MRSADPSMRINVLMTCHNEAQLVRQAVDYLLVSCAIAGATPTVFVADLGSDDDQTITHEGLIDGELHVLRLSENLFWAQGMYQVSRIAHQHLHDYTLWLNNDVELFPEAIQILARESSALEDNCVVVGSTKSPDDGERTYGGFRRGPWWAPLRVTALEPQNSVQSIEFGNGNILLLSRKVELSVGSFPSNFVHTGADYWFVREASKKGFATVLAPAFLGACAKNTRKELWRDSSLPRATRLRLLTAKNVQPISDWLKVSVCLGGVFGFLHFLKPFARILLGK